jgi:hypothetical protein
MFWDLNGATRSPRRRHIRHKAVTKRLFPTDDAVPTTISFFAAMKHPFSLKILNYTMDGIYHATGGI